MSDRQSEEPSSPIDRNHHAATQSRSLALAVYAATAYWLIFAAMSFYWAAGGTLGLETLGEGIGDLADAREPWFVGLVVVTGFVKLVPVVLVQATIRPWGRRVHKRVLVGALVLVGVGMVVYGVVSIVLQGLVLVEVIGPEEVDRAAVRWRVFFWNPWWVIGGLVTGVVGWRYWRLVVGGGLVERILVSDLD